MNNLKMSNFQSREEFITHVSRLNSKEIDKNEFIVSKCSGKSVLDLGCIDHSYLVALSLGDKWLHKQICSVATKVTGLDILAEDATELNKHGYNIVVGNAENFDLLEKFDVIVAGDLIEHLSNIGLFLRAVKRHMHKDSIFIFTTPNPFNFEQTVSAIFQNVIHVNEQHAVWLNPNVCWELVRRENFKITDFRWIDTRFGFWLDKPFWRLFINRFSRFIMRRHPLCKRDFALVLTLEN